MEILMVYMLWKRNTLDTSPNSIIIFPAQCVFFVLSLPGLLFGLGLMGKVESEAQWCSELGVKSLRNLGAT